MSETESYDISQPPETMVEQAGNNRVTQWLLITGDRRAVAAAMLVGTFVAFVIRSSRYIVTQQFLEPVVR